MSRNSYRKVFGGAAFLLLAFAYLLLPDKPIRMDLDLLGGVRLVYGFDFEEAKELGKITESELEAKHPLLQDFCAIIRERVDPYGAHIGFAIRPEGDDRVVIEFPFTSPEESGPGSTLRALIENQGELAFYFNTNNSELGPTTDLVNERYKLESWITNNPGRHIREFNRLATEDGGPAEDLLWFPYRAGDLLWFPNRAEEGAAQRQLVPVTLPPEEFRFTGKDLDTVKLAQDGVGFPAVGFSMKNSRRSAFGEFTAAHVGEQMAIVLNDEVVTNPYLNAPLYGDSIIEGGSGGFTLEEVEFLVQVLRSGSLRVRPKFISMEHVGSKGLVRTILSILFASIVGVGVVVGVLIKSLLRSGTGARPTSQSDQPLG